MVEARVIKFLAVVGYINFYLRTTNRLWKGRGQGHVTNFRIYTHEISPERLKLQTSNYMHALITRNTNLQMTNCLLSGRGQGHVTPSRISHP